MTVEALVTASEATLSAGGARRLGPVTLELRPGERVLVTGRSGSGKTSLLRLLSGAAGRRGAEVGGLVRVFGADPALLPPAGRPERLGFVPQNPDDALIGGTVAAELSFGPRCLGRVVDVAAAAARVGLRVPLDADPRSTSTGERQRLMVGAVLAAGARLLLLDEPLAHLDGDGADALLITLAALADAGTTVVMAEHRLGRTVPWCSRQLVLDAGTLVSDGLPGPFTPPPRGAPLPPAGPLVVELRALPIPRGVQPPWSQLLHRGERVALVGRNGVGKTTVLEALARHLGRRAVWIPADPDLTLFSADVRQELAFAWRPGAPDPDALARTLRIAHLLDRPPHAASRGERLRIAVAAGLAAAPEVLLLDEPTAGQDPEAVEALFDALAGLDAALVFATHDLAVASRHAHVVRTLS